MTPSEPAASDLDTSELNSLEQASASSAEMVDDLTGEANSAQLSSGGVSEGKGGFWAVFLSTFITIFLAELGDKTQMTTLLMSAESQAPVTVFLGAGSALVATSLIGVLLGQWIAKRISEETLDICAGILLLLITIGLVADIAGKG
ncbi:MAG: TMEM165/GDT1 family protein [Cyanobacteria bacterium J06554_11]